MIFREFKINFKAFIIWTAVIAGFFIAVIVAYPSMFGNSTEMLDAAMSSMPKDVLAAFNMDIMSISSASGWIGTEGIMFLCLVFGLYSSVLGFTILLKEESNHTIEFLYSKPVSRSKILTSKIICGYLYTALINIITAVSIFIALKAQNDLEFRKMAMLLFTMIPVCFVLFALSLFVSSFLKNTKATLGISFAITFGEYFISVIANISDKCNFLKYLTVFTICDSRSILKSNEVNTVGIIIAFALTVIFTAFAFLVYNHKDFKN